MAGLDRHTIGQAGPSTARRPSSVLDAGDPATAQCQNPLSVRSNRIETGDGEALRRFPGEPAQFNCGPASASSPAKKPAIGTVVFIQMTDFHCLT